MTSPLDLARVAGPLALKKTQRVMVAGATGACDV